MEKQYYKVKEFAELMDVSYQSVIDAIKKNRLNFIRIGPSPKAQYRIPISELERLRSFDLDKLIDDMVEKRIKEREEKT